MRISRIRCQNQRLPNAAPRIALNGGEDACATSLSEALLIEVETDEGITGIGVTMCAGPGLAAIRTLLEQEFPAILVGSDALAHERLWAMMQHNSRRVGFGGLIARAYAAIDIALWDIKAKAANLPLWRLLGGAKPSAPVFLTARDLESATKRLKSLGVMGVLLELGGCDPEADADMVTAVRDALGQQAWLSVSAEGKYDLNTAIAFCQLFTDEIDVDWFDDPLPPWDVAGYRRLATRVEQTLAVSLPLQSVRDAETWRTQESVRVLRPDVLQLGGITPWLRLAARCDDSAITLVPYRLPEIGIHLACGLQIVSSVEYVPSQVGLFTGGPTISKGRMLPADAPGLGIQFA